jgi:hypothetical protein
MLLGVRYTFLTGLGGSSSSLSVKSTTSAVLFVPDRGTVDASRDGSGGVLSDVGVNAASSLMAETR